MKQEAADKLALRQQREREASDRLLRQLEEEELEAAAERRRRAIEVDDYRRRQTAAIRAKEANEKTRTLARERALLTDMDDDAQAALQEALAKAEAKGLDTRPLIIGYNKLKRQK